MVTYSEEIFKRWMGIFEDLESQGKNPSATPFRYLTGLNEEDVKEIQEEILQGSVVITKSAKDVSDTIDLIERVKVAKQDHLVQDALIEEFNKLNPDEKCDNWEAVKEKYRIDQVSYSKFLAMCDAWINNRLQRGTKKMEFPKEAKQYVEWTILVHKQIVDDADVPWAVYVVSLLIEGSFFLHRHFPNSINIGLCVFNNTKTITTGNWSVEMYAHMLEGLLSVTGSSPSEGQFVLLAFVNLSNLSLLSLALEELGPIVKRLDIAALHFKMDKYIKGSIQYFSVLAFLSKADAYDDLLEQNRSFRDLDIGGLDLDYQVTNQMSDEEYLQAKKRVIVTRSITDYGVQGSSVIDLFGEGFIAEIALSLKKEIICLAHGVEEKENLSMRLLQYARSQSHIREWAKIPESPRPEEDSQKTKDTEDESEEESDEEPWDVDELMRREKSMNLPPL